jgi:hypothetical protein
VCVTERAGAVENRGEGLGLAAGGMGDVWRCAGATGDIGYVVKLAAEVPGLARWFPRQFDAVPVLTRYLAEIPGRAAARVRCIWCGEIVPCFSLVFCRVSSLFRAACEVAVALLRYPASANSHSTAPTGLQTTDGTGTPLTVQPLFLAGMQITEQTIPAHRALHPIAGIVSWRAGSRLMRSTFGMITDIDKIFQHVLAA